MKPADSADATVGEQAMWEVFGKQQKSKQSIIETGSKQASQFKEEAQELLIKKPPKGQITEHNLKAMENFTTKQPRKYESSKDDSMSDRDLADVVQTGINNCIAYVKEVTSG